MKLFSRFRSGSVDWKSLIKKPPVTAGLILMAIVVWVLSGQLGGGNHANSTTTPAQTQKDELFLVSAEQRDAVNYVETVRVRGRTEALKTVSLKAEEEGRIIATPVEKGEQVKKGQTICQIDPYAREANLAQARALAAQRKLEYDASIKLEQKGFRSATQVAADKAEYDEALALVRQAEVSLDKTRIVAPFDGLLNDRQAEVGDFLQVGAPCAVILTKDPYLVVGEVSDRQVARITPGIEVAVQFTDGRELKGRVRYISSAARIETRTYRVEVEVPNPEGTLRSGLTADILIPARTIKAHFVPPSVLVLKDDGAVGVRTVEDDNTVAFHPVEIVGNQSDGIWVRGLPDHMTLIVGGHNFVREGDQVKVSLAGGGEPQS